MDFDSIDEVLNALEMLAKDLYEDDCRLTSLKVELRFLRTFVSCARKYWSSNDPSCNSDGNASLGSLLHSIEEAVHKNGEVLYSFRLRVDEGFSSLNEMKWDFEDIIYDFKGSIGSVNQKITESYSYITALDCSVQSCDGLMVFIDTLLVNVADLIYWGDVYDQSLRNLIRSLEEKLTFFKRFIQFAELRGFEHKQLEILLTHLEAASVNAAASVFYMYQANTEDETVCEEMQNKTSELLQIIMSVDCQVREGYVQVLTASHMARLSDALEMGKDVLEDSVYFLLDSLSNLVNRGNDLMVYLKDQIPPLYKGLRFLRTILKKHQEKFDKLHEKEKHLIGAAVNEAGIIICLLFVHELKEGLAKEFDSALFNFVGKIQLVKVLTSTFIFPSTNELGFMDFLLENLKDLPSCEVDSIACAKDQIQDIQEDLASLRSFRENSLDQCNQALWSRVMEVARKTQFLVKSLFVGDIPGYSPILFDSIREEVIEINLLKMEALKISHSKSRLETHTASRPANKIVVKLDDEVATVTKKLTKGAKQLDVVSIVGMPGLGKTTLARNVYSDPSVKRFFHVRAWCTVSQIHQQKNLLLQILGCVDPGPSDGEYSKMTEDQLEEKLRQSLMRNKYLIVLDDVWNSEAWNALQRSFPDNADGSRILLTSRLPKVAFEINQNGKIHHLRRLTDKESWDLLQKRIPHEEEGYSLAQSDLGIQIAKHCQGLPLTVVTVAGILANLKQDGWKEIAERLSLSAAVCATDQCMDVLELSYRHLPDYLKPCLLYFGTFLEDQEIPFRRLMSLWIAEGLVTKSDVKSLEDVAQDYVYELISRSLVMVWKERSLGGVRTCRTHDLLHEFCVVKARKENFLQFLHGHDELFSFDEPQNLQRLCIFSEQDVFANSRLCCTNVSSLLFFAQNDKESSGFPTFLFMFFKHLKVLDLEQFRLCGELPSEIELLERLRYLAICNTVKSIPSSVGNLHNLETFIVEARGEVLLPDTIWKMQKLRRLEVRYRFAFALGEDNVESLHNLDTLSLVKLSLEQSEKILKKCPNIRRLKLELFESGESNRDSKKVVAMDFLSQLESLKLRLEDRRKYHLEFRLPLISLKKLGLVRFHWSEIQMIGKLPNLEVLKLCLEVSVQETWDMEELEFPRLKYLKLEYLHMSKWNCSADQFPCLKKLVLDGCWRLEEVPSCFGEVSTLEMIEVRGCSDSAVSSLAEIEEEHKDSGNQDFQIIF